MCYYSVLHSYAVVTDGYKSALVDAQGDLRALIAKRSEIDRDIQQTKQLIKQLVLKSGEKSDLALAPLLEYDRRGLTSGIRQGLKYSGGWKTAAEVRLMLLSCGYDLSRYANSSAVVNTLLNRMHKRGLVEKDKTTGRARYRWKSAGEEILKKAWARIKGKK